MNKNRPANAPARIYIEEWMRVRGVENQKALAKIMKRAEGTISKKLADPAKIDLQWLSEFADALRVQVTDLFDDPSAMEEPPPEHTPQLARLQKAAAKLDRDELETLISILLRGHSAQPHIKPVFEGGQARESKAKST